MNPVRTAAIFSLRSRQSIIPFINWLVLKETRFYLYAPSSALHTGPLAMTDGAAALLHQGTRESSRPSSFASGHSISLPPILPAKDQPGVEKAFDEAYLKLISRGGPGDAERWTSAQWMTECPSGSHVSNNETVAVYSPLSIEELGELGLRDGDILGPWVISGYKFFSSAADANMTILLAKTKDVRGLSAFYAPLKRPTVLSLVNSEYEGHNAVEWNGVPIVRQKRKPGKKPVATREIELEGMRGWLVCISIYIYIYKMILQLILGLDWGRRTGY